MSHKKRIITTLFVVIFFFLLLFLSVFSIFEEDRKTSLQENRSLAQFELPSLASFWNGHWFQDFETYCKDQFPVRDFCVRSYYGVLDTLGMKERNGYVCGKDGHILSVNSFGSYDKKYKAAQEYGAAQADAMGIISSVASEWGGRVIYLNVPHKVELFADMYPDNYENNHAFNEVKRESIIEHAQQNGAVVVETNAIMQEHRDEYIYFTTDNHWTIRGAYYAYQALLAAINDFSPQYDLRYPDFEELEITQNPKRMVGSYLKKWGDSQMHAGDIMEYAIPYNMPDYTRYDNGEISSRPLINVTNNTYNSFMGGDFGHTVVDTGRDELPSILYIGYSYSNPLEFMSVYNFDRMESLDPRHWRGSICEHLKESQPDFIVIVRDDIYADNGGWTCTLE